MKVVDKPTIELEEKDIGAIKGIYELIKNMPCSSLDCDKCPLSQICYCVITETQGGADETVLAMQKALNDALIE
jgi:hypothetical protein